MRLRNMLNICLVFWKSALQYADKDYAYKKTYCRLYIVLSVGVHYFEVYAIKYVSFKETPMY